MELLVKSALWKQHTDGRETLGKYRQYITKFTTNYSTFIYPVVEDFRATRPYLFSDIQNMYNQVVLVCIVNIYIPADLGRQPIFRYQVLQVP